MNVVVAAHPTRRRGVQNIRHTLGWQVPVVFDPDPDAAPSAIRTMAAALRRAPIGEPILVMQDDALPHPQIVEYAEQANRTYPTALVALYVGSIHAGGPVILRAARRGHRYATLPLGHFVPTVALVWPADAPAEFLAWLDANPLPRRSPYQDDEAVKLWRRSHRRMDPRSARDVPIPAFASIPSLCRHDNRPPSLLNHGLHGHRDALVPWDTWTRPDPWEAGW